MTERLTLYVPEAWNDGRPVALEQLQRYEDELIDLAGGFTLLRGVGGWRSERGEIVREPVRLYMIDVARGSRARERLQALADRIAFELQQEAVYVTTWDVEAGFMPGLSA